MLLSSRFALRYFSDKKIAVEKAVILKTLPLHYPDYRNKLNTNLLQIEEFYYEKNHLGIAYVFGRLCYHRKTDYT